MFALLFATFHAVLMLEICRPLYVITGLFAKAGYKSIEQFVSEVTAGFTEIRKGGFGSLLLIKRNGGQKVAYIKFAPVKGEDVYLVENATFAGKQYGKNKELLWERAPSNHSSKGTPNAVSSQNSSSTKNIPQGGQSQGK